MGAGVERGRKGRKGKRRAVRCAGCGIRAGPGYLTPSVDAGGLCPACAGWVRKFGSAGAADEPISGPEPARALSS